MNFKKGKALEKITIKQYSKAKAISVLHK